MRSVRIAICDDDEFALSVAGDKISEILLKFNVISLVDCFRDGHALLAKLGETAYDLVFLDISMPSIDGMEVAKRILRQNTRCEIAFISGREDMAAETFVVRPVAFVRKNRLVDDLKVALEAFVNHFFDEGNTLAVRSSEKGLMHIRYDRILYVESSGHRQLIYTVGCEGSPIVVSGSMKELAAKLSARDIVPVHKSYTVNMRYIYRLDKDSLLLSDGTRLPVSRGRSVPLRREFVEFLGRGGNFVLSEDDDK